MAYRALVVGIILFWVGMTGLLVRSELSPGTAALAIPPEHVFKQIFLHEQPSGLTFYRLHERLGRFDVLPRREAVDDANGASHSLVVTGNSNLDSFGLPGQRALLRLSLDLDAQQAVRHFEFTATIHELHQKGASLGIEFDGTPLAGRSHYQVRRGDVVQKEASGTPEELMNDPGLQAFGFDPRPIIRQALAQSASAVHLEARRSTMPFNNDIVDTYQVTLHGALLDCTMQTTPQGQILALTTSLGYDFYDETMNP